MPPWCNDLAVTIRRDVPDFPPNELVGCPMSGSTSPSTSMQPTDRSGTKGADLVHSAMSKGSTAFACRAVRGGRTQRSTRGAKPSSDTAVQRWRPSCPFCFPPFATCPRCRSISKASGTRPDHNGITGQAPGCMVVRGPDVQTRRLAGTRAGPHQERCQEQVAL